jgi:hypothetical protein
MTVEGDGRAALRAAHPHTAAPADVETAVLRAADAYRAVPPPEEA